MQRIFTLLGTALEIMIPGSRITALEYGSLEILPVFLETIGLEPLSTIA